MNFVLLSACKSYFFLLRYNQAVPEWREIFQAIHARQMDVKHPHSLQITIAQNRPGSLNFSPTKTEEWEEVFEAISSTPASSSSVDMVQDITNALSKI